MARDSECHIPEWAALMDASVPESACDRDLRTFRETHDFETDRVEPVEGS